MPIIDMSCVKKIYGVIFDFNGVLLFDGDIQEQLWNEMAIHFRKTQLTGHDKKELIHGKTTQAIFELVQTSFCKL